MRIITTITVFLCYINISFAQYKPTKQAYYLHSQLCNVVGTTEEDFSIEFFDDSTVQVSCYLSSYHDQYISVTRTASFGKYSIVEDTIRITYFNQPISTKYRNKSAGAIPLIKNEQDRILYPSNVFILNQNIIIPLGLFFSTTKKAGPEKLRKLEYEFENWTNTGNFRSKVFGLKRKCLSPVR